MTDERTRSKLHSDDLDLTGEEKKMMEENQLYWGAHAKEFKESNEVSWGDLNMMHLEIENIVSYLQDGQNVLDAGCSNGFSTFRISAKKDIRTEAFDYEPLSIAIAKEELENNKNSNVTFQEGNILSIPFEDGVFDAAYTIRVVINQANWKRQQQAIKEIHRVLKPNGLYLMSEAFAGGLNNLNQLRALASLKPLIMPEFNLYLNENELEEFLGDYFEIDEIRKFSSIYYVASRFLRYLTKEPGEEDAYDNEINNFFAKYKQTGNSGDFGIQKLYVLRKK
ncbi:MAG: class I SAM-dependent methyltransferase [Bacteroidetes bacterium]|nr:class I SAM-dependent methyltransferase [Bacteroidota bacterium]